ncbi:MAG: S9 family peptidase [Bacteroidetes bacterium]|nr:MAG: S9 family peptidase [Bacteroidota bacterium]
MQLRILTILLLCAVVASSQKPITLEAIWTNDTYQAKTLPEFEFYHDGVHFTQLIDGRIEQFDIQTGASAGVLFDPAVIAPDQAADWTGTVDAYQFSTDGRRLLIAAGREKIYRHSTRANFFVYDTRSRQLRPLHPGTKQRYAGFSPDGTKVAYVLENDLYYLDLVSGNTTQVTTDGQVNAIINGASDWVYEEEFRLVQAYAWSPDGKTLAFLRFDEREVPEFTMEMYHGDAYPELVHYKYPKVGAKNAVVSAHLYDLAAARTTRIAIPGRQDTLSDDYLPRLAWTPARQLCLTRMNRHQNQVQLFLADPATGACTMLYEETDPSYLDLQEPHFLSGNAGFIWQSEKSGYNHLYHFDMQGRQVAALTKGNWEVTDFYGYDEKRGLAYFQAAADTPMERELYAVNLKGKRREKLSGKPGVHAARFNPTFDYFIDTYATVNTPPQYDLYNSEGRLVRQLEQNAALRAEQEACSVLPIEFFQVPVKNASTPSGFSWDGTLNGWLIRPTAPQFQGKKLPVLMYVYGGPGSQQVLDSWKGTNYWWFQHLAQKGYVVACVDNRGTGGRGAAFQKITYQRLGQFETEDQIAAARYIGSLPYVDPARIGVFGWSYGGYMSSLCLLEGNDVFKSAIAVAPVTHWKWYDTVYTERYMRTEQENPEGYANFAPVNLAERLKGNYLLVHGLADDNVHFQHSAEMVDELIARNKQYDNMFYPNLDHGIRGGNARLHLYTMMTRFLDEKLKGISPEGARP